MNEGAAIRVLTFLNETSQQHLSNLAKEKSKVTVIGEENDLEILEEKINEPIERTELSSEQLQEFFKAVEDGSIDRLEELFDSYRNVDPNMTRYTESLLMTAIRSKRPKVAEYLIDQLGIDVNHNTDLLEFRPQTRMPVRHRMMSCRELAYDRGMMDLVDLIDITSDEVRPSIKRYLQKRLKSRLDEIHQTYLKRYKERTNQLIVPSEEKDISVIEEDVEDKENDDFISADLSEEIGDSRTYHQPVQSNSVPTQSRPYQSYIQKTLRGIEVSNEKSIDDTGKKLFRFTGYTVRFCLNDSAEGDDNPSQQSRPRTTPPSLPNLSARQTRSAPLFSSSYATFRSKNSARMMTARSDVSNIDLNSSLPIRENRTSICRSARYVSTPRVVSAAVEKERKSAGQRLLPKRAQTILPNVNYLTQSQQSMFDNRTERFVPVTLKSTATGLFPNHRLIRD